MHNISIERKITLQFTFPDEYMNIYYIYQSPLANKPKLKSTKSHELIATLVPVCYVDHLLCFEQVFVFYCS